MWCMAHISFSSVISWCCLTGSRQSWATTFWRSTMGQTSCLLWLAPLMVARFPSSCSAAATFFICCSPPITADPMLASKYYMKVSHKHVHGHETDLTNMPHAHIEQRVCRMSGRSIILEASHVYPQKTTWLHRGFQISSGLKVFPATCALQTSHLFVYTLLQA